jgi:hypothetical protein
MHTLSIFKTSKNLDGYEKEIGVCWVSPNYQILILLVEEFWCLLNCQLVIMLVEVFGYLPNCQLLIMIGVGVWVATKLLIPNYDWCKCLGIYQIVN